MSTASACAYLTGVKVGRLTVQSHAGREGKRHYWNCQCECGAMARVQTCHLTAGSTRSCGCLAKERARETLVQRSTKHGGRYTRLYSIWTGMKKRCHYPKHKYFKNYGAQGITVCDAWRNDFSAFRDWALANGYAPHLTINRDDTTKGYEPSNCNWMTRHEQEQHKWRSDLNRKRVHDAAEDRVAA